MYSKSFCRDYLNDVKKYINLSQVAKATKINRSSLSYFLKSTEFDAFISKENLNELVKFIQDL